MSCSLMVLWTPAADAPAFEDDYKSRHLPLARNIDGLLELRSGRIAKGGYARVATLRFADMDGLRAGMKSPAGQAVAQDAARLEAGFGITALSLVVIEDDLP